jgi:hypothetical protein
MESWDGYSESRMSSLNGSRGACLNVRLQILGRMPTAAEIRAKILEDMRELPTIASALDASSMKRWTAILIEPRKHRAVRFVLQNLLDNLPTTWTIRFVHGATAGAWAGQIRNSFTAVEQERIVLVPAPVDNFSSQSQYSTYVASREFIESIPTEQCLIVQTDSMINPAQKHKLEKFLQYDYVGAPWPWDSLQVGNGGFSLRRKAALLKVIDRMGPLKTDLEDQYFAFGMLVTKASIPTKEVAREFSVEQLFHPKPFAVHKVWDHIPTRFDDLCEAVPGLRELAALQGLEE